MPQVRFLWLLAIHINCLRTTPAPDNLVCSTFLEACNKRGLLDNDTIWVQTLTEAAAMNTPNRLRYLFAYLLLYSNVSDPVALYTQFHYDLMHDFLRNDPDETVAEQRALQHIENVLQQNNNKITLSTYSLPTVRIPSRPVHNIIDPSNLSFDINEESDISASYSLTDEQRHHAEKILGACVDSRDPDLGNPGPYLF